MIAFILIGAIPAKAEMPTQEQSPKTEKEIIDEKIDYYAELHAVSPQVIHTVIKCESSYNTKALGDYGNSRGLVQIHKKYHPTVTDEMAYDPDFAIEFLAEKLSQGKGGLWSCYRKNYSIQ